MNISIPVSFEIIIQHPPINNRRGRTIDHHTDTIQLFVEAPSLGFASYSTDYIYAENDTPSTITTTLLAGLPREVAEYFTPAAERYVESEVAKLLLALPA